MVTSFSPIMDVSCCGIALQIVKNLASRLVGRLGTRRAEHVNLCRFAVAARPGHEESIELR
jgi:hypothetical protein